MKLLLTEFLYCLTSLALLAAEPDSIDWNRARELHRKQQAGQQLTAEEKTYLARAIELHDRQNPANPNTPIAPPTKPSIGVKPLTEMTAGEKYKGEDSGLYGGGHNEPTGALLTTARRESAKIQPLDADGKRVQDGKIVLVAIGMSNTTQEFSKFVELANRDPKKSASVVIVDGAQGGRDSAAWVNPGQNKNIQSPWAVLEQRLQAAGVTAPQVQIAWIKQARIQPGRLGEFPEHTKKLQADLAVIVAELRTRYPNVRIAYLSSRIYAGYATTTLNPEPYAFESAFAVRWLIRDQAVGDAAKTPVLLWGPYLWGDGATPRKSDGLVWRREDLREDGTHPSETGRQKVAELLLNFFKSDPLARVWFLKR